MLRISYKDRVTNEEVLRRANIDRTLMKDIVKRQMEFFRHVIGKGELENSVVTGFIEGKRAKGRQRDTHLTYLQKMTPIELIHLFYESDATFSTRVMSGYICPIAACVNMIWHTIMMNSRGLCCI